MLGHLHVIISCRCTILSKFRLGGVVGFDVENNFVGVS